jgi:hypothetical protein
MNVMGKGKEGPSVTLRFEANKFHNDFENNLCSMDTILVTIVRYMIINWKIMPKNMVNEMT